MFYYTGFPPPGLDRLVGWIMKVRQWILTRANLYVYVQALSGLSCRTMTVPTPRPVSSSPPFSEPSCPSSRRAWPCDRTSHRAAGKVPARSACNVPRHQNYASKSRLLCVLLTMAKDSIYQHPYGLHFRRTDKKEGRPVLGPVTLCR
jgi:hypothetical protein